MTLLVVAAVTVGVYLYTRVNDEIRHLAERMLAEEFPQLNCSIGGARLVKGRGIAIYDLAISETSHTQTQANLVMVDEIMLVCDVDISQLMNGKPQLHRAIVKHPQVFVTKDHNGRWNLESLLPLPEPCENRPPIAIQDAQITFTDRQRAELPPLTFRDVNFTISGACECESPSIIQIGGVLSGSILQRADLTAKFDFAQKTMEVAGDLHRLKIDTGLVAWATAYSGQLLGRTVVQAIIDGKFVLLHQMGSNQPPQLTAQLQLSEGRVEDPRLPRPITELAGAINCDRQRLKVDSLQGNCGSAQLALSLERNGWRAAAPLAVAAKFDALPLDKKLYHSLPPILRNEWDKYLPTGVVDVAAQATFDGQRWLPRAMLTGRELSFEADKFHYRVTEGSGSMVYQATQPGQPATLDIDLVAMGGGRPLTIKGQVVNPAPLAKGWIDITGQNVKIEKRMIAALPEKTRRVIESMHPEGTMNVHWHMERAVAGQPKFRKALQLEFLDGRVTYEKFPYPLSGIRGFVIAEDDHWTFRDLVSGGSRKVQCSGTLQPTAAGKELRLRFVGQEIPFDTDLERAVPPGVQQAWRQLRPRGEIDLTADLVHIAGNPKPAIRVAIQPHEGTSSIEPQFFPYLMEKLAGVVTYDQGRIDIAGLRAKHGRTTLRTNGSGHFGNDGSWNLRLEGLAADRLTARRELVGALPLTLQKLIDQLKPTGSFALQNSTLQFSKAAGSRQPVNSNWDVQLDCHQTDLQVGIDLKNIYGKVRLVGKCENDQCTNAGELEIDTATFEGVQFTDIRGPFWADNTRCLLGKWAVAPQGQAPRQISANVYNGRMVGSAWVTFNGLPQYGAEASLAGSDLSRIMTERFPTTTDFSGKVAANVVLRGHGRQVENMRADGNVQITDAKIYELPLLVGLLKVLRNSTPDSTAFNQSDMRFRIQGRHIYLDQLDFLGDAVSFFGKGYTNFDQELNLAFYGIVGRNEIRVPFIQNFVNNLGKSTLQMYVDGTLSDPQIHNQAFPVVNNLIEQIQSDLEISGSPVNPRQAQRGYQAAPPSPTNR